jgi:hypothetical protein
MSPVHLQKPAPNPTPHVHFYLQRELHDGRAFIVQSVSARATLMFEFFWRAGTNRYARSAVEQKGPHSVVFGMLTRPHGELRVQGPYYSFIIMFQLAGVTALLGVDTSELTNRDLDIRIVFGSEMAELEERLVQCDSFPSRAAAADAFLARRIKLQGQQLHVVRSNCQGFSPLSITRRAHVAGPGEIWHKILDITTRCI